MRKLIQLSPSTAVLSLPSRWVKKHHLVKGDELEVQELENQLIVSTKKHANAPSAVTIDVRALPYSLTWIECEAAYIAGHDEITFTYTPQQEAIIECVKNEVPGMMVTRQQQGSITFKDITVGKSEDVHSIITRILHMIADLIGQASRAAKQKDWAALTKVKSNDHIINSYIGYAQRQINKFGFEKTYSSNLIVTFLKLCETFADSVCALAKSSAESKIDLTAVFEDILAAWRATSTLFLAHSEEKLIACERIREHIPVAKSKEQIAAVKTKLFEILEVIVQIESSRRA